MDDIKDNEMINNEETAENSTGNTVYIAKGAPPVPYIVYEGERARNERLVSRLMGVITLLIVLLAATNAFWLYEWMQYDYVTETTTENVDMDTTGNGNANYNNIENGGEIEKTERKDGELFSWDCNVSEIIETVPKYC